MNRSTLFVALTALASAGCLDYTVETTLRPDGSGLRTERMELTRNADFDLSQEALVALTRSGPARGWTRSVDVQPDGDTTWIQERRREFGSLSAWAGPEDEVILLGALPGRADERIGYVRLGDIRLRSSIQVRSARRSDGTTAMTYRESFVWDGAAEALIEFVLRDLDGVLVRRFPTVPPLDRGGILGYARARLWQAGEEGLFSDDDSDAQMERAVADISTHAYRVIRIHDAGARVEVLSGLLRDALSFDDDASNRLFTELLPGLNLAFNTSIVYRLTMPGTVTSTNAASRDGGLLQWEFSPLDDLPGPVEIFAESVIRR